jgi:uridine kinase
VDAAGKTTLADELGALLAARGRPVIRAGIDGFG